MQEFLIYMPTALDEKILPSDILQAVLYEQQRRGLIEFDFGPIKIHKAFYDASKEFPEIMQHYDFTKVTNPYSATLDEMIRWHRRIGIISVQLDDKIKIIDSSNLDEPSEKLQEVARYICDRI